MWLPLALALAVAPPKAAPKPPAPAPAAPAPTIVEPVVAEPPAAPSPPPPPPAPALPMPSTEATATVAAPPPSTRALSPWDVALQLGLDVPGAPRLPMASTRVDVAMQLSLPSQAFASVGARTGYSYVAGDVSVVDPVLGVDEHALLMAHRVPVRLVGRAGLRGDDGLAVGVLASGGADVALVQAQSFGRVAQTTSFVPGGSVGAFVTRNFGDTMQLGVVGEWDSATVDLAAAAPGLSGDLSALRLALDLHFNFG